jgi:hypothetical protein
VQLFCLKVPQLKNRHIAFQSSSDSRQLLPRLLNHGILRFGAMDDIGFLARMLTIQRNDGK